MCANLSDRQVAGLRAAVRDAPADVRRAILRHVWVRADADGNGTLDRAELLSVLVQMGADPAEVDIDAVFDEVRLEL